MTPYLLIALYLLNGSAVPELRTELFPDKPSCAAAQSRYLSSQAVGSKWAICKNLINPIKKEPRHD